MSLRSPSLSLFFSPLCFSPCGLCTVCFTFSVFSFVFNVFNSCGYLLCLLPCLLLRIRPRHKLHYRRAVLLSNQPITFRRVVTLTLTPTLSTSLCAALLFRCMHSSPLPWCLHMLTRTTFRLYRLLFHYACSPLAFMTITSNANHCPP